MSKGKIYHGSIAAVNGDAIRVEIWKEGFSGASTELTFTYDEPVVIEWAQTEKIEPVQSSSCTLKIESVTDRMFVNTLYSVKACDVELRLYRNNSLYWSGTLDTEQYSEPYSYGSGYDVNVTFQDFAVLDRKKYKGIGVVTLQSIIDACLTECGCNFGTLNKSISTKINDVSQTPIDLSTMYVNSANFYDEEGESSSMREVLEGILKPLSLRLKQKNGQLYLYDINAIADTSASQIIWNGTDAQMSADVVYNDVEVTWSKYGSNDMLEAEVKFTESADDTTISIPLNDESDALDQYLSKYDNTCSLGDNWMMQNTSVRGFYEPFFINKDYGFDIRLGENGKGMTKGASAKYFKMLPKLGGSDAAGIAVAIARFDISEEGWAVRTNSVEATPVMRFGGIATTGGADVATASFRVPAVSTLLDGYEMRLKVEACIDPRPMLEEVKRGMATQELIDCFDHIYIPYNMVLNCDNGYTYYWQNASMIDNVNIGLTGQWVSSKTNLSGTNYSALLHFCSNMAAPSDASCPQGFTTNTYFTGSKMQGAPTRITQDASGDRITLNGYSGTITISISNIVIAKGADGRQYQVRRGVGWYLIKSIKATMVDKYGKEPDMNDLVTKATVNADAKETLEVDTILDVSSKVPVTAKGLLLRSDGEPYKSMYRAGNTGTMAQLMCNTIYSQYAERKITLSGTAKLCTNALCATDAATEGKFLITAETQRIRESESQITLCQIAADNYVPTTQKEDD